MSGELLAKRCLYDSFLNSALLKIQIPEGTVRLQVVPDPNSQFNRSRYACSANHRDGFREFDPSVGVAVAGGTTVWVKPVMPESLDPGKVSPPQFKVWSLARRIACEARDRTAPWLGRR